MDIEIFKRLSIPKIEAGKMTEVVRDVIKEVKTRDQDVFEKVAKDLKPVTEKFDKEIEEISELREDVKKQVVHMLSKFKDQHYWVQVVRWHPRWQLI